MSIVYISALIALIMLLSSITLFSVNKKNLQKRKKWEEQIYKQVINDLQNNNKRAGLWRLAMNETNGIEEACKSLYVKYCVQSIIGEHEILGTVKL